MRSRGRLERRDIALVRRRDDDPVALRAPIGPRVERVRDSSARLSRRIDRVLEALDVVERRTASALVIPSISTVRPEGTVSKDRLTLSGKTVTDVESVRPAESVTVRTIS